MPEPPSFGYCLRCGQPLRSHFSRETGFGLQCWDSTPPGDRMRLLTIARAVQADLDEFARAGLRPRLNALLARVRWIPRRAKS